MICSICLRNTQNWNCLGRDYRFGQGSSGRKRRERKSSWGHPPTALSPLPSALSWGALSNDNSEKPFVRHYGTTHPFSAKKNVCISPPPLPASYLTRFRVETKYRLSLLSRTLQNKMIKSKRSEIQKTQRQFMPLTHKKKHTDLSPQIGQPWGDSPTFVLNSPRLGDLVHQLLPDLSGWSNMLWITQVPSLPPSLGFIFCHLPLILESPSGDNGGGGDGLRCN